MILAFEEDERTWSFLIRTESDYRTPEKMAPSAVHIAISTSIQDVGL
jgi:hypothetical protein